MSTTHSETSIPSFGGGIVQVVIPTKEGSRKIERQSSDGDPSHAFGMTESGRAKRAGGRLKSPLRVFRNALLAVAVVVLFSTAIAAETGEDKPAVKPGEAVNGLRMEARVLLAQKPDTGKFLYVKAFLINEGTKDVIVLTKKIGGTELSKSGGFQITFNMTGRQVYNGRLVITSLVPYEPVTLRPGDVAQITSEVTKGVKEADLKGGESVRVVYTVWEGWRDHSDRWVGEVSAEVPIELPPTKSAD